MKIIKLKIDSINNSKTLVEYRHFNISGNFNDWSKKKNYLLKTRLFLEENNTGDYYNLFHANYCDEGNNGLLEIHVAKVYLKKEENNQLIYTVEKPNKYFFLEPKNKNATVEIKLLVYDLNERCPEDKNIYICGTRTNIEVPPFKGYDCPEKTKDFIKRIPTQPETKKGNILQGQ